MNETFADVTAWNAIDNLAWLDTILLDEMVTVREGGGLRLVGDGVTQEIGGRTRYPGAVIYTKAFYSSGYFECYGKIAPGFTKFCFFLYDSLRGHGVPVPDPDYPKNEIDSIEYGGNLTNLSGTYKDSSVYIDTLVTTKAIMQNVYMKLGIYWDADAVRIYWNDHLYWETTDPAKIPAVPMNVYLQWAFGEWAALPSDVSWPAYFDVDWVKVWVKDNTYR